MEGIKQSIKWTSSEVNSGKVSRNEYDYINMLVLPSMLYYWQCVRNIYYFKL